METKKYDYSELIKVNGLFLRYVEDQKEELCLTAVKQNPLALQFVKEQTEKICLEAVKRNPYTLEYIKNQTEQICLEAVKKDGMLLKDVERQTYKICIEAVKQAPYALEFVKNQTEEICLMAVEKTGISIRCVENQTEKICLAALKSDARAQHFIKIPLNVKYDIHYFGVYPCRTIYYVKIDGEYLFSIGCQESITKEQFIDRIYNDCDMSGCGLEEYPHRQYYLDFLDSLERGDIENEHEQKSNN